MISHVRTEVLRNCGLIRNPQQTTHTHPMWGQFQAQPCDKPSTFLGNLVNNIITAEILKSRNYRKDDPGSVGRKVRGYCAALLFAKTKWKGGQTNCGKKSGRFVFPESQTSRTINLTTVQQLLQPAHSCPENLQKMAAFEDKTSCPILLAWIRMVCTAAIRDGKPFR